MQCKRNEEKYIKNCLNEWCKENKNHPKLEFRVVLGSFKLKIERS